MFPLPAPSVMCTLSFFLFVYTRAEDQLHRPRRHVPNLFKEYMSKGMFACTADYLKTIAEIQKLTQRAAELYNGCQQELEAQSRTFPRTSFEPFDELMERWETEENAETSQLTSKRPFQAAEEAGYSYNLLRLLFLLLFFKDGRLRSKTVAFSDNFR